MSRVLPLTRVQGVAVQRDSLLLSPVAITLGAGGPCTTGSLTLRPQGKKRRRVL